jgi:guanylate kinase
VNGRDYHFVTIDQFRQMQATGEFLECKEVFGRGDWYGTPRKQVELGLLAGKWIILEIDVQGALAVMDKRPEVLSFFVHPGSLDELELRLRRRGTDDETAIARRLEVAAEELQSLKYYRFEIINRDVHAAVTEICTNLLQHSKGAHACSKN